MLTYEVERASSDELQHFGIKGQKWGVRRYQELNGTLTKAGIDRYRSKQQRKHDKYQEKADGYARVAKENNLWRKNIEENVKTYTTGKGQAWRQSAESETKYAQKAIKAQNKANQYMSESEKKNVRDFLMKNGIESERFSAKNLKKADKEVLKSVMKDPANFTRKDELRIFNESLDKSLGVKDSVEKRHPDIDFKDNNDNGVVKAIRSSQKTFTDAVYKDDSLYRKYGLDQSSSDDIAKKRFKPMLDYIDRSVAKERNDLDEAGRNAKKWMSNGRPIARKPKEELTDYRKKLVNYWDVFSDSAMKYIEKNVPKEEQDLAKGIIYYSYIDW